MAKYKLTLFVSKFMKVGEDYQVVDVPAEFYLKDWDDVQNIIGYLVEGSEDKPVRFEIKKLKEATDEN